MRLATWNVNSLAVRLPQLLDWLAANPVDVIVLQETKLTDDKFPHAEIAAAGYQVAVVRAEDLQRRRAALARADRATWCATSPASRTSRRASSPATVDGVRIVGAYFPNGQAPGTDKFAYKMRWLDALREWLRAELARPAASCCWATTTSRPRTATCTTRSRGPGRSCARPRSASTSAQLLALGLHDAFRLFEQPPKSWSWWDYRNLAFRKNQGLRIDHILVSEALKPRVGACTIDKLPRKNERPSDHAPVIVELHG